MTLDEAMKRVYEDAYLFAIKGFAERSRECTQIADWLKELSELRVKLQRIESIIGE